MMGLSAGNIDFQVVVGPAYVQSLLENVKLKFINAV